MRNLRGGGRLFSASDLVYFLSCGHHTHLDLIDLVTPLPRTEADEATELVRERGHEHEHAYLNRLRMNRSVVEIASSGSLADRAAATRDALKSGVDIVYQAVLLDGAWHGYADFLRRIDQPSSLGAFSYEPVDTKLAQSPSATHVLQLCVYGDLLASVQGKYPETIHLVLGDGREASYRFAEFAQYYDGVRQRFEMFCKIADRLSYPEPCAHCGLCRWKDLCDEQWERDDHLSLVANIGRPQIERLNENEVTTVRALASLGDDARVPRIGPDTLARLRHQARLQIQKRDSGKDVAEILPLETGRGFHLLPQPSPGDLFFDMEGDPHYPDGLEYLFGIVGTEASGIGFTPFWGHDRDGERAAFQATMDFLCAHVAKHPDAHIYHYAQYEPSALRRLSTRHGTREAALDDLLRRRKFVDLFTIVRQAIRVSEPSYSLKNLEVFYLAMRGGDVKTAGQSIVVYERWRRDSDPKLLDDIAAYNELDCVSTRGLRNWLVTLRPAGMPWPGGGQEPEETTPSEKVTLAEAQRQSYETRLLSATDGTSRPVLELVAQLLEFHRREAKPQWWAMFDRQNREVDELIDDVECIGGCVADPDQPPGREKQSHIFNFRFPPQEFKLAVGDSCRNTLTLESAGTILDLDPDRCVLRLKRAVKRGPLPDRLSLGPSGPIDTGVLRAAIYRFADSLLAGDGRFGAVSDLLCRSRPRLEGKTIGEILIPAGTDPVAGTIAVAKRLTNGYLVIQGPPGAGKTYTSSRAIVELIRSGRKVGVTSNSHKAINNLLKEIERHAREQKVHFRGVKKSGGEDTFFGGTFIRDVTSNDIDLTVDLIAGTAWLFARPELEEALDYLFVDEAGQVSLANVVGMGLSARNIVLVGDQMQLGQPIQGVHPGDSGLSVLDYLLGGNATVAADFGAFLPTTRRMHPDICRFISDAVYESRLQPETANQNQCLLLEHDAHPDLARTGLRFVSVEHSGCSQKCEPEGTQIRDMYLNLLAQRYRDRDGAEHAMSPENILIVAPYNVQVNYLKSILPPGARVGTVDRFQGQEAEVVLISMTTSSGEELPRNIEFLYSRNRLNVAISRARCLAVVLASPRLLEIQCRTVEQMRLVNTLCWVRSYSDRSSLAPVKATQ